MSHPVDLSGSFYTAYKALNPGFDPETFSCAENTVERLLHTATSSDHPGMLLGKVQSGKTRTFISTLALGFDNGYDIAIVLSKNSKALIEQTTKRLNSEFAPFVADGELEIYDIMHAPESFGAFELDSKLIFVAKKQSDNLRRLTELFSEKCPAMASRRVLIIDDEADNASIGYSKKDGLIEAKKIATQISELRSVIEHTSFLQVTATPYSLYLQPNEIEVENVTTFMPTRPKFTSLVPVSPEYVGGDTYFGEAARSQDDTLESLLHHSLDHLEFERLKKEDRRSFKLEEVLTSPAVKGFRHAIVTFIVGGCIQRINGTNAGQKPKKLRYSFLLHSEAGREAHNWQGLLTTTLKKKLIEAAQADESVFRDLVQASYDDLQRSLLLSGLPVPTIEEVVAASREALTGDHITITKVNSDDDVAAMLDNSGQLKLRSPLNIFIGGQVIDRGVTWPASSASTTDGGPTNTSRIPSSSTPACMATAALISRSRGSTPLRRSATPCSGWKNSMYHYGVLSSRAATMGCSSSAARAMARSCLAVRIKSWSPPRRRSAHSSASCRSAFRPGIAQGRMASVPRLRRSMSGSSKFAVSTPTHLDQSRWIRPWNSSLSLSRHSTLSKTMLLPSIGARRRRLSATSPSSMPIRHNEGRCSSGRRGIANRPAWRARVLMRPTSKHPTPRRRRGK